MEEQQQQSQEQLQQQSQQQSQEQSQQQSNDIDSEDESPAIDDQNVFDETETACNDPNNQFCKSLLEFKHKLYSQTVLMPETEQPQSQNIELLNPYLNLLEYFRGLLVPILTFGTKREPPPISEKFLQALPSNSRQSAIDLHAHIVDTARQNRTTNRELLESYKTFIDNMFHTYPFLMNNEFS